MLFLSREMKIDINENQEVGNREKEAKLLLFDLIANHLAICCQIIMYHLYDSVLIRCARIMQTPCAFNIGRMF